MDSTLNSADRQRAFHHGRPFSPATCLRTWRTTALALLLAAACAAPLSAQQVHVGTPSHRMSDSYFERFGTSWNLSWGRGPSRGFFRFGGNQPALPPFGGMGPGGARFGFQQRSGDTQLGFRFFADEGSRRSLVMESPSVTFPNGSGAFITDAFTQPFVTGLIPQVGSALDERLHRLREAGGYQPLQRSEDDAGLSMGPDSRTTATPGNDAAYDTSTAARGDRSLSEIRRRQAQADAAATAAAHAEAGHLLQQARQARLDDKPAVARIFYRQALRYLPEGDDRESVESELREIVDH